MAAIENYIQVPPNSSGSKVRTIALTQGSGVVHMEVTPIAFNSGLIVSEAAALPVQIRPSISPGVAVAALKQLNSLSGGVCLTSAAVRSVRVKAYHFNSGEVYVGHTATGSMRPYSGFGYILRPDEYVDIETDQAGKVFVFGSISGLDYVTSLGTV